MKAFACLSAVLWTKLNINLIASAECVTVLLVKDQQDEVMAAVAKGISVTAIKVDVLLRLEGCGFKHWLAPVMQGWTLEHQKDSHRCCSPPPQEMMGQMQRRISHPLGLQPLEDFNFDSFFLVTLLKKIYTYWI